MTRILYGVGIGLAVLIGATSFRPSAVEARVVPTPVEPIVAVTTARNAASTGLTVRTARAEVRYRWQPDPRAGNGAGAIVIEPSVISGATPITVRYAPIWAGKQVTIVSQDFRTSGNQTILTQVVTVDGEKTILTLQAHVVGGSLVLDMDADTPTISAIKVTAPTASGLNRVALPYNPVAVYRSDANSAVTSAFLDWSASAATRYDGDDALYEPKTDGRRNPLRERLVVTTSDHVISVLPNAAWPRSRYYDRVGGRLVLDVTETLPFAEIESGLDRLVATGLSNCILIVHVWQRMGYDNGLPVVLPANAFLGGSAALTAIGRKAKAVGCEFALHQNYIDQYQNSGVFDAATLAKDSGGRASKAWLNAVVGQQSYTLRPDMLAAMAQSYAPAIKDALGTTATFVDVNSSFAPWERTDMDAAHPGGGRFSAFLLGSKAMFATLQSVEKGPVFGEGNNHFYWTGALDGVAAQMSAAYAGDDVRVAPLWVDPDLLKIHPFQHNFGMGFYNRYAPATASSRDPLTDERSRDVYRTQQIAFAHLPYRSGILWGDARLFVQEAGLSVPVARAYRNAAAKEIRYPVGGRWVPIETALAKGPARAVRVRYDNNLVITANTGLSVVADPQGRTLDTASWSASGAGLGGWSTSSAEGRRDFMRDAGAVYADPRKVPGNWDNRTHEAATPVAFGAVRTNGQTWLRCVAGIWTILGFANRGTIDVEVQRSVVAAPKLLRAGGVADVPVTAGSVPTSWHARLASGHRYTTAVPCKTY